MIAVWEKGPIRANCQFQVSGNGWKHSRWALPCTLLCFNSWSSSRDSLAQCMTILQLWKTVGYNMSVDMATALLFFLVWCARKDYGFQTWPVCWDYTTCTHNVVIRLYRKHDLFVCFHLYWQFMHSTNWSLFSNQLTYWNWWYYAVIHTYEQGETCLWVLWHCVSPSLVAM